jgi:hypothetical protein
MTDRINDFADLETAAKQFQEAINFAYTENCPLHEGELQEYCLVVPRPCGEREESPQVI